MITHLLGKLLRGFRAGERHLFCRNPLIVSGHATITLTSSSFPAGSTIPLRHAGQGVGSNVSPALEWNGVPTDTAELILVMEDPDAPLHRPFVHLIATGIAKVTTSFADGMLNTNTQSMNRQLGVTTFGQLGYTGPRALPGHGPHSYVFQIFALRRKSGLSEGAKRNDVKRALEGNVLAYGEFRALFERK
jgi:hypothetical protein